ncbi:MAG: C40 family peptidase [Verrucomicrobiales bacterium]|nr:C40 family peptidase [Verrucomicrobiales bacterium]
MYISIIRLTGVVSCLFLLFAVGLPVGLLADGQAKKNAVPAQLEVAALVEYEHLDPARKKVIDLALKIGRERRLAKYIFGSADPDKGGFDCSGAMFYLLQQLGMKLARSSASQFEWVKAAGLLVAVPATVQSTEDKVFAKLQPGDLLFWAHTYQAKDGRTNGISHVQMYLGKEKVGGRRVMIGSTDGRSYHGNRQTGYGVFDFKLPRKGAKAKFVGFGPPPGLLKTSKP